MWSREIFIGNTPDYINKDYIQKYFKKFITNYLDKEHIYINKNIKIVDILYYEDGW